jgi:flagellar biosynthesis chaperone FliJ
MELSAISKRKKALEKVKEKRLAEFKIQKSRAEQKKLDENYQILELTKE